MAIGRRPQGAFALAAMLAALGVGAPTGIGSMGARPPEVHQRRNPFFGGWGGRRGKTPQQKLARRLPSEEQRAEWDRQALGMKKLPVDLHPHVRRRELRRRGELPTR